MHEGTILHDWPLMHEDTFAWVDFFKLNIFLY